MMLVDRYIWKNVLQAWVMVMLVLMGLTFIFSFIEEIADVKNDYQLVHAFVYVLATLPDDAFEMVSMATLMACLIGLGQLASNSELIILRACGISVSRILISVIQPVLLIIGLALLTAQFISPYTSQFAESYKATRTSGTEFNSFKKGYWQREGDNFVYINRISAEGTLYDVTIFTFDQEQHLRAARFFDSADIEKSQWKTHGIESLRIDNDAVTVSQKQEGIWQSEITLRMLKLLAVGPEKLSVSSLYQYGNYLKKQNQSSARYHLEFWNKIFLPLSTVAMVLIAGSFIFGSLRDTPMGSRVIVGVVIALVFNQVQTLSSHIAVVYQLSPMISALIPPLIAFLIGAVMVQRTF